MQSNHSLAAKQTLTPAFVQPKQAPLSHQNLVKLYGGCWDDGPDKLCIVLEFCPEGSLSDLLKRCATSSLTWADPFHRIATEISSCFVYLHHEQANEPLIHRDLKPDNVLIADGLAAKVADFGESTRFKVMEAQSLAENGEHKADVLSMVSLDQPTRATCIRISDLVLVLRLMLSTDNGRDPDVRCT